MLPLLLCLWLPACKPKGNEGQASLNHSLLENDEGGSKRERRIQPPQSDDRRLLFAQIVEDAERGAHQESGIIEGLPFKRFLRSLVGVKHDEVKKQTNEQLSFDKLMQQPGLYRGQVVTLARGVFLEVSRAEAPSEYGLPPGYTIMPAVFVDSARDVYALRILCPPGSKVFDKIQKGIEEDALPVARVTGYFMKLYARKTNDPEEPPWRRPLLICPEPEFSQIAEPRKYKQELVESKSDRFLPSHRVDAPGAEERLVVELNSITEKSSVCIDHKELPADLTAPIAQAVDALKKRLPADQVDHPSAAVLIASGASRAKLNDVLRALRAAGVQRLAVKSEQ
jgi:hypothetical protein